MNQVTGQNLKVISTNKKPKKRTLEMNTKDSHSIAGSTLTNPITENYPSQTMGPSARSLPHRKLIWSLISAAGSGNRFLSNPAGMGVRMI
jgi:hypothetical protein